MDTVAAVSPYLSYVHIIFDANQPGSRPMHIYSVLDTGASVTIIHARFASMHNSASQQQGKHMQGRRQSGSQMQRVNQG